MMHSNSTIFAESDLPTLLLSTLVYQTTSATFSFTDNFRQALSSVHTSPAARVYNLVPRLHSIVPRWCGSLTIYQQEGGRGCRGVARIWRLKEGRSSQRARSVRQNIFPEFIYYFRSARKQFLSKCYRNIMLVH